MAKTNKHLTDRIASLQLSFEEIKTALDQTDKTHGEYLNAKTAIDNAENVFESMRGHAKDHSWHPDEIDRVEGQLEVELKRISDLLADKPTRKNTKK